MPDYTGKLKSNGSIISIKSIDPLDASAPTTDYQVANKESN